MKTLEESRREFAEKIRVIAGLRSISLVQALATVPREEFLGPGPWLLTSLALEGRYQRTPDDNPRHLYDNVLVALDAERNLNNGEPAALARWLDALDLSLGDRLLHIGCGVGYYTAIAVAATPGGSAVGVELDPQLAERANSARFISPVGIYHCSGARTPEGGELLKRSYSRGGQERVRSLRRDRHRSSQQCWLHAPRFCLSFLPVEDSPSSQVTL